MAFNGETRLVSYNMRHSLMEQYNHLNEIRAQALQYNYPNEIRAKALQDQLSSSASIIYVSISAFFCFCLLLVITYLRFCYCRDQKDCKKPVGALPLPVVYYNKSVENNARGCVVCLSDFEDEEAMTVMPGCGHVFHPSCINQWLVKQQSCPVCRCRIDNSSAACEGTREEQVVVVNELERSRSSISRSGREERMGMRRSCSF